MLRVVDNTTSEIAVDFLAQQPLPLQQACYGSDVGRLAVAGGKDGAFHRQRNTWVLEGPEFTWGAATVALPTVRTGSAGLLLGDQLVCVGGWEDEVGWWVEQLVAQGWSVPQGLSL